MSQDPNADKPNDAPATTAAATTTDQTQNDTGSTPAAAPTGLAGIWSQVKTKATAVAKDVEKAAQDAYKQMEQRLTMEGQLKEARDSLGKFLNPSIDVEKQIPVELMKNAKGIVLLSVVKISAVFGGSIGSGVIITKQEYGGWSSPCSIGLIGGQAGFNIGAQLANFVIVLRDPTAVQLFSGNGQIRLGADASVAAGPLGRYAQVAVGANENKNIAATVSYSEAKGLYVGFALEGAGIRVREVCNETYYGKKTEAKEILNAPGDANKNEDYAAICQLLNDYILKQDQQAASSEQEENKQPL